MRLEATTFKLKLRKIGNSVGLILPNEMLARLRVKAGQQIFAVENRNGYLLTAANPTVGKQVETGIQLMDRHSGVFAKLAK
jgi:putative addiction module antidote